jgi:hypothetical protein
MVLAARWRWPTADVPGQAMGAGCAFSGGQRPYRRSDVIRAGLESAVGEGHRAPAGCARKAAPGRWCRCAIHKAGGRGGAGASAAGASWIGRISICRVVAGSSLPPIWPSIRANWRWPMPRFDDFHRRIAFVMHDIKNLASQFALLARNAERRGKPRLPRRHAGDAAQFGRQAEPSGCAPFAL